MIKVLVYLLVLIVFLVGVKLSEESDGVQNAFVILALLWLIAGLLKVLSWIVF